MKITWDFIRKREHYDAGDVIVLKCDTQCNFFILSDSDFASYQRGDSYHYHGKHCTRFPARIKVPSSGDWNVVVDLGGGRATIKYSLSVIKAGGRR